MNLDPQQLVVLLVVAAATAYLAVRLLGLRKRRRGTSCGGCGSCAAHPGGESPAPANLIAVETLCLRKE